MADYDLDPETGGGLLGGSGGGWLGNLLNFGGGRSTTADLYGDLFSKKQLAAIQQRESQAKFKGLLDVLSQAAAPSTFKKNYGQILGQIGGAMMGAEGGDKAATTALGGQLTAQKIAQLKQEAAASAQYQAAIQEIMKQWVASGGAPGTMPPGMQPPAAPPAGAPPGAPPSGPTPGAPVPNPAGNGPPPPQGTFGLPGGAPRPPANWGLPPPPGAQRAGLPQGDPNQMFAGLLGGGAQPPFPPEEGSLPPPDTVIPSGPGGLLDPGAIRTVGARADDQWLARNAPFPTRADPVGDPIRWVNEYPEIDLNDPASQGPGSPAGRGAGVPQDNRDVVIPAPGQRQIDPRIQAQMTRTQSGGAPSAGAAGPRLPNMPQMPALPAMPGGAANQPIPGIGVSPQGLAILDLFAAGAGKGTPFKGLTDTYYKDPAYLGQAAQAQAAGAAQVNQPFEWAKVQQEKALGYGYDLLRDMAKDNMTLDAQGNVVPIPGSAAIRRENADKAEADKAKWKATFEFEDVTVQGPNGPMTEKLSKWEIQARRAAQLKRDADRDAMRQPPAGPQLGDIIGIPALSETQKGLRAIPIKEYEGVRAVAVKAPQAIQNTHELRRNLDAGMFTGIAADWEEFYTRIADAVGIAGQDKQDKLANTQVFSANLGQEVANFISAAKWTPVSNVDLKFAQEIVGGKTLTEQSLRRLLELREKYARLSIQQHNDLAKKFGPTAFGEFDPSIDLPPAYQRAAPETQQPAVRTYNPATKRLE